MPSIFCLYVLPFSCTFSSTYYYYLLQLLLPIMKMHMHIRTSNYNNHLHSLFSIHQKKHLVPILMTTSLFPQYVILSHSLSTNILASLSFYFFGYLINCFPLSSIICFAFSNLLLVSSCSTKEQVTILLLLFFVMTMKK